MPENQLRTCENCRYYHSLRNQGQASLGECHRYAPKVYFEGARLGQFPAMPPHGWCGEWALTGKKLSKSKMNELYRSGAVEA